LIARLRSPDALVLVSSVVALVLLGPLRDTFAALPIVLFASVIALFMTPGILLSCWFTGDRFSGAALAPVSFAFSTGLFGLLAVPALILHETLELYLKACGAVLVMFLLISIVRIVRWKATATKEETEESGGYVTWLLWAPFLALGGTLTFLSRMKAPIVDGDTWDYLSWVREYISTDRLALHDPYFGTKISEFSRVKINGWILEQAALSHLTGIDPVELVLKYLAPTLVILSLLAFYALARTLFKSELAALLAGCLYCIFLLIFLHASYWSFGTELLGRIVQDKYVARYVFLPVALCIAVAFLEDRKFRYLALFAFLCWSVVSVHPAGLAILGLSMAGFGLVHVLIGWRKRAAWTGMLSLGVALLSILIVPLAYLLITGKALSSELYSSDIAGTDPMVLANMVFLRSFGKILELKDGLYIVTPTFVSNPVIAAGYVLGCPLLIWRLKRSLGAQLLLGTLFLTTFVCYVPQVATFVGNNIVAPGQIYRMVWPIPLAALLTVSWVVWEIARYIEGFLNRFRFSRYAARLVPLALVAVLIVAATPPAFGGVKHVYARSVYDPGKVISGKTYRFDPIFTWMQHNIKKPSVIMAPDYVNLSIPAYSANANVVSFRGTVLLDNLAALEQRVGAKIKVPQGDLDVRAFYSGPTSQEMYKILKRQKIDYVMVSKNSSQDERIKHMTGFVRLDTPSQRYSLFAVDYKKLSDG